MTVEELLDKCGEPTTKTVDQVDVHGPNANGAGNSKRGTVTVEKWTYDRGSGHSTWSSRSRTAHQEHGARK